MNPLYLHGEGYQPEEEVRVNTILGTVFSKTPESEENDRTKDLEELKVSLVITIDS